jgi:hypothetical protein
MQTEELDITTSSQSEMKRVQVQNSSLDFFSNFWPPWPTYSAGFLALSPGPIRHVMTPIEFAFINTPSSMISW